ncbi:hypothetical protein [Winogradskyella immobilis]|uniref:Lipoprotein n=1 Tax=Winogradskyella immobilis TaxID=2816852 RepID=A0ABS8EJV0_9FLAO|nr:hypothetical protein [Winogradskyella immobilis]MCC1483479.1 hypothetical protein [Winogradskyella immobilis]MCG0015573.1 hypothetical protein [Winogradskyella immobilis]
MKRLLFIIVSMFVFSCTSLQKEYDTHLKNGLETYPNARDVDLNFIHGLSMKKVAFIKKNKDEKMLIIRLNDDALALDVEKYSLAVKTFLDKNKYKELLKDKEYISTPIKPSLITVNSFKYIEVPYSLDVKRIEKIEFFLFDRDKFRKVLSKPITISNMGI